MIRWVIVAIVVLLSGLGVIAVTREDDEPGGLYPEEDQLAFALDPGESVILNLPPRTNIVHVSSSVAVEASGPIDVTARYAYGLSVTLESEDGKALWSHDYEIEGRISYDPAAPDRFSARLESSSLRTTDPRTVTIPVAGLTRSATRLRLTSDARENRHVFVRATRPMQRSSVATRVFERQRTIEARRRLIAGRSSLGYVDLPDTARDSAWDSYEERLTASGDTGKSYRFAKIVVTPWRAPFVLSRPSNPVHIGRWRRAALNLDGNATVRIATAPGTAIEVRERAAIEQPLPTLPPRGGRPGAPPPPPPEDKPTRLVVPESGVLAVDLPGDGARTVSFGADAEDAPVFFMVAADRAPVQVGGSPSFYTSDGDVAIVPDARVSSFMRLDDADPVISHVAPGQTALRVTLRSELRDGERGLALHKRVRVTLRAGTEALSTETIEGDVVRSRFDRFRVPAPSPSPPSFRDASDPLVFYIRFDPTKERRDGRSSRVTSVEIRGDRTDLVQLGTPEPGVTEDVPSAPYKVRMAPESRWRNALYDARRFATLTPANAEVLARAGRTTDLVGQARIDEVPPDPTPKPERVLTPVGPAVAHTLITSTFVPKGAAMPVGATRPLQKDDLLRVEASGLKARKVTATYRAGSDALGGTATLVVDGQPAAQSPIVTLSGSLEAAVSDGPHRFSVQGLGAGGQAFIDAPPADGGAVQQRREVYEIAKDKPVVFSIQGKRAEHLNLILSVVTPKVGVPWSLHWSFEGAVRPIVNEPLLYLTPLVGVATGTTGDPTGPSTSDSGFATSLGAGVSRVVIPIGDDLEAGLHKIRITLDAPDTVWIRAVLVGQEGVGMVADAVPHIWTESAE